jgi:hypothetical protein
MNLDKHELKLLVAALAISPAGEPVRTALLVGVFDRPAKLNASIASLHRCGAVLFDAYQGVIRVRADVIWKMLNEFGDQTELFTNERPLDAVLAELSSRQALNITNPCDLTRPACEITRGAGYDHPRPKPPEPPPPKPANPCVTHAVHAPHAMPEFMPEHARHPAKPAQPAHVHEHVISGSGIKKLHEHGGNRSATGGNGGPSGTDHNVGELSRRTTAEMMADIARLAPSLSMENAAHWRERIEHEDAALVNSVIRQAQLQRGSIRNVGGWMNACYLNAIKKTTKP